MTIDIGRIREILGDRAALLDHKSTTIHASSLHLPGPSYIDNIFSQNDRTPRVIGAMQRMMDTGRLAGTGYVSILPVDQGIEHSAGASFAPNPIMFDPENIVKLAIEGGANAVASTLGVLGAVSRKYAHKIPYMLKINHNETLSLPPKHDQVMFATVKQAFNMGCTSVGATLIVVLGVFFVTVTLRSVAEAPSDRASRATHAAPQTKR